MNSFEKLLLKLVTYEVFCLPAFILWLSQQLLHVKHFMLSLSMHEPVLVAMLSDHGNISYSVNSKINMDEFSNSICAELKEKGVSYPKTVV